mmetsp:Transcript_11063/g.30933  ORF Transcript_11063/g.30933 Transcript_11063/m.30933 type:complete len:204 (-) Transcript_11063:643-1254(-)
MYVCCTGSENTFAHAPACSLALASNFQVDVDPLQLVEPEHERLPRLENLVPRLAPERVFIPLALEGCKLDFAFVEVYPSRRHDHSERAVHVVLALLHLDALENERVFGHLHAEGQLREPVEVTRNSKLPLCPRGRDLDLYVVRDVFAEVLRERLAVRPAEEPNIVKSRGAELVVQLVDPDVNLASRRFETEGEDVQLQAAALS